MKQLILLSFMILIGCTSAFAQPKTVTDYFLAMPNDKYSTDMQGNPVRTKTALLKFRKSLIKIEDVKNGYLKLEGPWEGWAEIALFKRSDGSYLIAESSVGCGPACDGSLTFYTYANGKWSDVTTKFAPKFNGQAVYENFKKNGGANEEINSGEDLTYYYRLPRAGRTLKVACNECADSGDEMDFVLLEYEWNGEKFLAK